MARAAPRQIDITRALRAAKAAGVDIGKFEISGDKIVITPKTGSPPAAGNEWDEVLPK